MEFLLLSNSLYADVEWEREWKESERDYKEDCVTMTTLKIEFSTSSACDVLQFMHQKLLTSHIHCEQKKDYVKFLSFGNYYDSINFFFIFDWSISIED